MRAREGARGRKREKTFQCWATPGRSGRAYGWREPGCLPVKESWLPGWLPGRLPASERRLPSCQDVPGSFARPVASQWEEASCQAGCQPVKGGQLPGGQLPGSFPGQLPGSLPVWLPAWLPAHQRTPVARPVAHQAPVRRGWQIHEAQNHHAACR